MANREALKDLNTRLASRLQAARTDDVAAAWLAVEAGGAKYLLPLAQAGEIFPWTAVMSVPYAQAWFLGVANLRGGLFGVVDLASYVTGGKASHSPAVASSDQARAESRLVSFNAALEINCVVLVDRLAGLRHANVFAWSEAPGADAPPYFGASYVDAAGVHWQSLDLLAMSRQPEFLSISA
jgi:twitching motility protein PilI